MEDADQESRFRRAMGAFATGVTVVTAAGGDGRVAGITVNSFTSVSLKPRLLLWCLGEGSARYAHFAAAQTWGVTILAAEEEQLARRFAIAEREGMGAEEYAVLEGAPVLRAGVARFACATRERIPAGDHLIILGEVLDVEAAPGAALTFYRSRYGGIEDQGNR
jgi:3-hydroxy-9,10-secoandrosta-1,3,5(10)-triene-9,17-dione monooxygenase reductase component